MRAKSGQAYRDRRDAGTILAAHVRERIGTPDAVVLALPRGGVPMGFEVARELHAPLDVLVVRKLGVPGHEEFAMGAIAAGGFTILNHRLMAELDLGDGQVAAIVAREAAELQRREETYRENRPPISVRDRVAILVDDGLATGFTLRAAIAAVRERGPRRLIAAIPVGAPQACAELSREVGILICPLQPEPFHAVGLWYQEFESTTDEEVRECLAAAALNQEAVQRRIMPSFSRM